VDYKRYLKLVFLFLLLLLLPVIFANSAAAQSCSSQRIVNQYACVSKKVCEYRALCPDNSPCVNDQCETGTCNPSVCVEVEAGKECRTTGSQTVACSGASAGCEAKVDITTCSGGGTSEGSCKENTSTLTYQCYVNDSGGGDGGGDTGGGDTGGGNSCAWCATSGQCAASNGSWGGGEGYCAGTDRCCDVPDSGGGGGGGGDALPPCPSCSNRFCGQSGCGSDRHKRKGAVPVWTVGNQGTIVIPYNDTQVSLIWQDPSGRDSCSQDREGNFDLRVYEISGWGGAIRQTIVDARFPRSSVYIADTENNNHEYGQMRYKYYPTGRYYRALVRSVNTICSSNNPALSDWATVEFQVHAQQTGTIYLDTNNDSTIDANGRCVSPTIPAGNADLGIINQRNTAPWTAYNFDGWGYVWRSDWVDIINGRTLGTPQVDGARFGSADSIVDNNLNSWWASGHKGSDVNRDEVGYDFLASHPIQVLTIHQYNDGGKVLGAPHATVGSVNGSSLPWIIRGGPNYTSFMLPPVTSVSSFRFSSATTGFADDERWGVAEIQAFINPNPVPELRTTTSLGEQISKSGWNAVGDFSINTALGLPSTLQLDLNSDEFTCSCPEGCQYNLSGANQNMNYFVNVKADPWFQIVDGGVAAYGDNSLAIANPIPEQCTSENNCSPVLVRTPNSSAPAVITGGGTVDVSDLPGQQTTGLDDENKNWLARLSATPARQDFAYFRRIYKFPSADVQDDYALNFNNAPKPDGTPNNENVTAYYHEGDLTITSPWVVNSGESYVILVSGDLKVNANITVANGGFLAFVTSKDIIFDSSLGSTAFNSSTPVVEGVFIADGKIRLPESQLKFVGAGTFVGWAGFDLLRNFESTDNWYNPTELFVYRPDFLRNAPEEMKTPRYEWNEVNP